MAVLEAGRWIDASLQNKNKMAETIADKAYVNTSVDAINQRILGRYQNGLGKTWDDPNYMKFFNDGAVNFPYLSDGMWFLTQHKRWGLLKEHPDYLAVAKQINQIEIYKQAAERDEDQRAQGRHAQQQADRRRGLGRQGPGQVRRQFQGARQRGLNEPQPPGADHGQSPFSKPPQAAKPAAEAKPAAAPRAPLRHAPPRTRAPRATRSDRLARLLAPRAAAAGRHGPAGRHLGAGHRQRRRVSRRRRPPSTPR